jgi:NAD(P)H-dependent FMN reductase
MSVRILVIAGSTRTEAYSKKLAHAAVRSAEQAGASATFVDLRDYPMPLYDGDLEAAGGLPEQAIRLRELMQRHDALLIATPEYNSSIPAVLKNALDWLSRPHAAEPGVSPYRNKVAGLLSSSPGPMGGLRGLVHLRQILQNVGCLVITEQFALGNAGSAFAADGSLADARQAEGVAAVVRRLIELTARLAA